MDFFCFVFVFVVLFCFVLCVRVFVLCDVFSVFVYCSEILWCWVWTPGRIAMALSKLMEIQIKDKDKIRDNMAKKNCS